MKTAVYCRVSKRDQTNLNQELELKNYCQKEGHEIYDIYKEDGVSGTKTSRLQLDRMLNDMREKKFDCIVVWKYDRLGRSTIHLLQILEEMKNKNVRLIATSQNIDTSTPMGKFFFTVISGIAELEREFIIERTCLGLERARQEGKPIGKRGKDKKERRKSGYWLRWSNNKNKV